VVNEFDAGAAERGLIGLGVAPLHEVGEETGNFPIIERAYFQKPPETARREDGKYNRTQGGFTNGTYTCEEYGLEAPLDDRRSKRYATFIDFERAEAQRLRYQILLAHERRVSALVMSASTFTAHNVATSWTTIASSTPLADLDTACAAVEDATGLPRSQHSLILPRAGWEFLRNSAALLDVLKSWNSGIQGPEAVKVSTVASYLEIREILVGRSSYDTANEGIAASMSAVWPAQYGMLAVLAREGDALEMPGLARTMLWTADSPDKVVVEEYREEASRSDVLRVRHDADEVLTTDADVLGYLLDITAAS